MSIPIALRPLRRIRPSCFCVISSSSISSSSSRRGYSGTLRRQQQQEKQKKPFPFPTVPSCPPPTCDCADTPDLCGEGMKIDRESRLNGAIPDYAEQVLVCTGRDDWPSRIETIEHEKDGEPLPNLAAFLKEEMQNNPFHRVSILNSSFPRTEQSWDTPPFRTDKRLLDSYAYVYDSVYLLPTFKYIPFFSRALMYCLDEGYLRAETLHPAHEGLSPWERKKLTRKSDLQSVFPGVQDVQDVLVLVCGHRSRDLRCGVFGPLIKDEFDEKLRLADFEVAERAVYVPGNERNNWIFSSDDNDFATITDKIEREARKKKTKTETDEKKTARVGLISHIGGHKFAGNVIIYVPPRHKGPGGKKHALAGCGIWYGRVEPKHVEGLVNETIVNGRIVEDMFRGGFVQKGGY
ncbi:hypothetical protein E4U55_003471 [Claviceps digitariae]|nr:hypothetical protein E4U55_003471 [Claviceps digitariae]